MQKPRTFWQRIARMYVAVALIVFNTVLLIVLVTLIAAILLPDTPTAPDTPGVGSIGINVVYSPRFNRSAYYFMPPEEVDALLSEYDRMAAEGHWQVHPWTSLTLRYFRGQYLNMDFDGHRLGIEPSDAHADKPPLTVWGFGGSTLFGWGLADDFTLPSQLQVALQSRIPDRQVIVQNFAVPIYNSAQELALFIAYLRRQEPPDIAFFLDGVNDVWFIMNQGTATPLALPLAGAWEAQIAQFTQRQPWITVDPSFPLIRLARELGIAIPTAQSPSSAYYAMSGTGAENNTQRLRFALENYRNNQRMAATIGDEYGVATYFFLQPWEDPYYPEFRQNLVNSASDHFFDITDALADADPRYRLLVDDLHYSDYATQILAEKIAGILMETHNFERNPNG